MRWIILGAAVAGCASAPERIAGNAGEIRTLADSSRDRFVVVGDNDGVREQDRIIDLSAEIGVDASAVDPTTPQWVSTLELALYAAITVAVVVILWQTGLGLAIRRLLGWIPRRKRSAAKLLREACDHPTQIREAAAAIRTADPLIDAAWRRP